MPVQSAAFVFRQQLLFLLPLQLLTLMSNTLHPLILYVNAWEETAPVAAASSAPAIPSQAARSQLHQPHRPHLPVKINNLPLHALIDEGSDVSVLRADLVRSLPQLPMIFDNKTTTSFRDVQKNPLKIVGYVEVSVTALRLNFKLVPTVSPGVRRGRERQVDRKIQILNIIQQYYPTHHLTFLSIVPPE